MSEAKEPKWAGEALTAAQQIALARLFQPMVESEAWKAYLEILERHRLSVGLYGHSDTTRRPGYYQGLLEALDELSSFPGLVVEAARAASEAEEVERRTRETRERTRREFAGSGINLDSIRVGAFGQGDPDEVGG